MINITITDFDSATMQVNPKDLGMYLNARKMRDALIGLALLYNIKKHKETLECIVSVQGWGGLTEQERDELNFLKDVCTLIKVLETANA
jgi:hypothetical protein